MHEGQASAIGRRAVFWGIGSLPFAPRPAQANGDCPSAAFYQPFGRPICNSFIDPKGLQVAAQQNSEWCWAATISNIFAYHGYQVAQSAIVRGGIGQVANQPGNLATIQSVLNRRWTDDAGKSFQSTGTILLSADARIEGPSNEQIIDFLAANNPLLFCNMSHAMMLVSVNYVPPKSLPRNVAASIVVDPWPGMGLRALTPAEQVPAPPLGLGQLRLIMRVDVAS